MLQRKNTEAIAGISGVQSVFLYAQLQFERVSGTGKEGIKKKKRSSGFLIFYRNKEEIDALPLLPPPTLLLFFSLSVLQHI